MFVLFGTNMTAVCFGANMGVYVLPMLHFERDVRGKYHGISSAAGKFGAAVGTFLFVPVMEIFGLSGVMIAQSAFCAAGAYLVFKNVPSEPLRD